jgi:hypothetical protein
MSADIWREFFTDTFLPNLSAAEKPALLIVDGHEAHIDLEFMLRCKAQGVDVVQEPAHTPSVCQALDQVCFSVLKEKWRENLGNWYNRVTKFGQIAYNFSKWDVPYIMKEAYEEAFTIKNVKSSWERAGLNPLDVSKPLARIKKKGT